MPASPNAQPSTPATDKPKRARREGPSPEGEFLIAVRNALRAGVPVDTKVLPVLDYAENADGAASWRMLTKTLDGFTAAATTETPSA